MDNDTMNYGDMLAEKIRENTRNLSELSDFDRFVLDNGYRFDTKEELQAGYARLQKANQNILVTLEEFLAEAEKKPSDPAADTYEALVRLVEQQKLQPREVFGYARYRSCLNQPEAVIAYQTGPKEWTVNDCETEITEEQARIKICKEWGFEASRIRIVGTPYYDATDYQFIRFDGPHMSWLWHNGGIDQVFC